MKGRILVVDDERNIGRTMAMIHEGKGYKVEVVESGEQALECLADLREGEGIDLVYMDIQMPGLDGMETLARIRETWPELAVVMISGHASIEKAVEALKLGAVDFLEKGFSKARLLATTESVMERIALRRENSELRERVEGSSEILGKSDAIQAIREQIARVAPTPARVLITGESGTGKELVARAIHRSSQRNGKAFVKVNCAAIPETLIESELFGVVKGAFTGADVTREGKFAAADGGTLFLDEVADMSLTAQAKVLRVLQEGEFEKVGSQKTETVDVRVLAATNKRLEDEVEAQRFREDLYYRLAVVPIQMPPLRARKEDIGLLVEQFAARYCVDNGLSEKHFSREVIDQLARHAWPGNIRELRNRVERLLIMSAGSVVESDSLVGDLGRQGISAGVTKDQDALLEELSEQFLGQPLGESRRRFEDKMIRLALDRRGGNVTQAAADLGLERTNLHKKIKLLGIT